VMIVLTTNNVQNIRKLMLRPGRIDTVVSVTNPDADTVYRLIKFYAGEALTGERAEYDDAIKPMVDQSPSFVAEVVKKAKLRAVTRPGKLQITADDVRIGARMMVNHVKLMNAEEPSEFQDLELGQMTVRVSR
jgi:ATP-dependent 26S proteasome regulatory subunit